LYVSKATTKTAMKILMATILLSLSVSLFAQKQMVGRYRNYFGNRIQINADNTFEYTWHADLSASWTKGTWTVKNDTVSFHIIPIYDTINYRTKNGLPGDTLILSSDTIPERLTQEQLSGRGLSSGGQNYIACPNKLYYKRNKLYNINYGKLSKKKIKGWTNKRWAPWFFKSDD